MNLLLFIIYILSLLLMLGIFFSVILNKSLRKEVGVKTIGDLIIIFVISFVPILNTIALYWSIGDWYDNHPAPSWWNLKD